MAAMHVAHIPHPQTYATTMHPNLQNVLHLCSGPCPRITGFTPFAPVDISIPCLTGHQVRSMVSMVKNWIGTLEHNAYPIHMGVACSTGLPRYLGYLARHATVAQPHMSLLTSDTKYDPTGKNGGNPILLGPHPSKNRRIGGK